MSHSVKILACSASKKLASQIASSYGQSLGDVELQKFSDSRYYNRHRFEFNNKYLEDFKTSG